MPTDSAEILVFPAGSRLSEIVRRAGLAFPADAAAGPLAAVVDLRGADARERMRELKASKAAQTLPILALVGPEESAAQEALGWGADEFVRDEMDVPVRLRALLRAYADRDQLARRKQDLKALLSLTSDYAATLDVSALLHDVMRRLAEELSIERCSLVVVDEEHRHGYILAASDNQELRNLRIDLSDYPEIREVIRTSAPVLLENAASHRLLDPAAKKKVAARGISAIAALPLSVHDKVLGVLMLRAQASRKTFTPREVEFALTVAHATALALRNAKLVESIRERAERESSARQQAEAKVKNLSRFEAFFENVTDGIMVLDAAGAVAFLNPAGALLFGISPEEARGRKLSQLFDADSAEDLVGSVLHGEMVRSVDLRVRTHGGGRLTLSVGASPLKGEGGAAIISFRDVTEERRLENELEKTKDFLERLIDSSADAILAADMKGQVIVFNKGAERITGYKASEVVGKVKVARFYPEGVAREVMKMIRSEQHGGKGRLTQARLEVVSKAGELVPVHLSASMIYEGDKEVATVGIFSDLRERAQLEHRLSAAQEKLEEAEKQAVLVELAGTAAHELNQPLTSVMGYAEMLKRKMSADSPHYRAVDIIYREADRMADIVRKIGKITRYETKAYVGTARIVDLDRASGEDE